MIIQAHLGIIVVLCVMLGWRDYQAVGKIWLFLSNFSAQNLLINSHQAQKIAAHPFHHLPMGLKPDDNPRKLIWASLWHCVSCCFGKKRFWQDLALLVQLFSPKPPDQQPSST
jgi:hypothetical protein